jgi:hypothetical protein
MQPRDRSKKRRKLTKLVKDFLLKYYETNRSPSFQERMYISQQLSIPEAKIKNWFQNRRAKTKSQAPAVPCLNYAHTDKAAAGRPKIYPGSNDLFIRR